MADNSTTSPLPEKLTAADIPEDAGKKAETTPDANTGTAEESGAEDKKHTSAEPETVSTADAGITPANRERRKRTVLWLRLLKTSGRCLKWFAIVMSVIVLLLLIFRDVIIKSCITGIGSFVAGVEITIDELETSLDGKIKITNLTVGNPDGFETPHLLKVSSCYLDVDMSTLLSDRIIFEELDINELHLTGEYSGNGDFNISEVINDLSRKFSSGESETQYFINKFSIRNSSVKICNREDKIVFDFKSLSGSTTDGKMELAMLTISSPAGFQDQHIATVKSIETEFDAESVFSDDIKIRTVTVGETQIVCEFKNDGSSNLQTAAGIITASDAPTPKSNTNTKNSDQPAKSISIDQFVLADLSMRISDQRTGCKVEQKNLKFELKNCSFTSSSDCSGNFMQKWIDKFCEKLAKVTFAPNLLKDTLKKTGDFFVDSANTVVDFFTFE